MKHTTLAASLVLALASITGCASTEYGRSTLPDEPHTTAQLDLVLIDATARASVPARVSAATAPAVDRRLASQVLVEQGGRARTDVRLCVGNDGAVTDVALVRSSGLDALDRALMDSARGWRYQPSAAAPASLCHEASIGYTVR